MKKFEIGNNEAGQRMDKYLKKLLPKAGNGFLYKMLRKKNIVLNEKRTEGSVILADGDCVTLYLSDETIQKFSPDMIFSDQPPVMRNKEKADFTLPVLYEDRDILVVNKPAGLLSQKAGPKDDSANERIIQYLLDTGAVTPQALLTFHPSVCNRLDRNTSGILVAGKTLHGLQVMSRHLKERLVQKYYICIAAGVVENEQHLKGYLYKDTLKNKVQISFSKENIGKRGDGSFIETAWRPVCTYGSATVLEVCLYTGRPHQIRAHLASAGHPIIGDPKYGDQKLNEYFRKKTGVTRQLLHAARIILADGREITAPLPEDFSRVQAFLERMDDGKQTGMGMPMYEQR